MQDGVSNTVRASFIYLRCIQHALIDALIEHRKIATILQYSVQQEHSSSAVSIQLSHECSAQPYFGLPAYAPSGCHAHTSNRLLVEAESFPVSAVTHSDAVDQGVCIPCERLHLNPSSGSSFVFGLDCAALNTLPRLFLPLVVPCLWPLAFLCLALRLSLLAFDVRFCLRLC